MPIRLSRYIHKFRFSKYLANLHGYSGWGFFRYFLLLVLFIQCVSPFEPDISESANLINIDGSIIKGEEVQKVIVSQSTSLKENAFVPVGNCTVYLLDDKGNRFDFSYREEGNYTANIGQDYLNYSTAFQLHVTTVSGDTYVSAFDTIYSNEAIDSVYYLPEKQYSINSGTESEGFQFYIDVRGSENSSRFYRWRIAETWEYHARYSIDFVAIGDSLFDFAKHDSLYYCYRSENVTGLYLSNTLNLKANEKKKIPLHFISHPSIKLSQRYSYLVNQYSLSEAAYNYWNQKRVDILESGGIYTTQPANSVSNIQNINNPDEVVLGYFWASAKTERRFFVNEHFTFFYEDCEYYLFTPEVVGTNGEPEIYGFEIYEEGLFTADQFCLDCRLLGGSITKPDYWDNN